MPNIFNALFEKFGPTLTFEQAATALHYKSIKTAYTACSRGIFPIGTIDLGVRLGCLVADLAEFLTTGVHQKNLPSVPQSRKSGRPRKNQRAQYVRSANLTSQLHEIESFDLALISRRRN